MREKYSTDLTDEQWVIIELLFKGMRNRKWDKQELVNAVLYLADNSCKWRNLPHDFSPYSTVHSFYRRARLSGLWDKILQHLVGVTRRKAGRNPNLTYVIIDSQSVDTAYKSEQVGYDGGKKGHKRHIVTDTLGNILAVKVHRANLHDTRAGIFPAVAAYRLYPTIQSICGDAGYRKTFVSNVEAVLSLRVDISSKIKAVGFHVIPKRWIVERTFAWLNNSRRLAKDFERTITSQEAMIKIPHIHTLLKRL